MKSVLIHFLLAALGLSAAYAVHATRGIEDSKEESVDVVACSKGAVDSVAFTSPDLSVTLTSRPGDGARGHTYQVTEVRTEGKSKVTRTFAGAQQACEKYLALFAPMRALRKLGKLSQAVREELSLVVKAPAKPKGPKGKAPTPASTDGGASAADSGTPDEDADAGMQPEPDREAGKAQLSITCQGGTRGFKVGAQAFGSDQRYLEDSASKVVYLASGDLVSTLRQASNSLMQRKLIDLAPKDIAKLELQVGSFTATLLHRDRLDAERAEWVDAKAPTKRNEQLGTFIARTEQLSVLEYLPDGAAPGQEPDGAGATKPLASAPSPVLKLRYKGAKEEALGEIEVLKIDAGPRPTYYARGSATGTWVTVVPSLARQVEDGARTMAGLAPLPRAPAPEPSPEEPPPEEPPPGPEEHPPGPEEHPDGHPH